MIVQKPDPFIIKGGKNMAKYKCSVCGYIYDEAALGAISNLEKCPVC